MKKGAKHRHGRHVPRAPAPAAAASARSVAVAPAAPRPGGDPDQLLRDAFARWDKPARALDLVERAVAAQPQRADLRRLRGHLLRRVGRLKPAAEELAAASRLAPDDRQLAYEAALVRLATGDAAADGAAAPGGELEPGAAARLAALAAARRGDAAAAEAALAGAAQPVDRALLGALLAVEGQTARAVQALQPAAVADRLPPSAQALAHLYLGAAHVQRRELVPAAAALEAARDLGAAAQAQPYLAWTYQQQAVEAVLAADWQRAAERFQRLAGLGGPAAGEAETHAAAALGLHGQERARQSDYEGAVDAWTAALAMTPHDTALRQHLAVALERAGRTDEAIPHWHEVIHRLSRDGRRAGKRGRQAPADAEEPGLHDHTRAVAHRHLADLYLDQDDVERAIEHLERSLQAVPGDVETRRALAHLLVEEGRAKAAIRHFEQIVAAAPESAADRAELGVALLTSGAVEAAREQLERAYALDPASPVLQFALGSALASSVLAAPGRPNAVQDAQRAVDLAPPAPALRSLTLASLGAAQLAGGDLRTAKKTLRQAVTASRDKALTTVRVGNIYWQAGARTEALAAWTSAMKKGPRADCVFSWLVESWAIAGDAARCQECLEGGIDRCGVECVAETVARVAAAPEKKPALALIRQVLHTAYDETDDPIAQLDLISLMMAAGDAPAARSRLNTLARDAVQTGDGTLLQPILDLDTEYRLLDRKSIERVLDWFSANMPDALGPALPGNQPYQEKGWERWDR